jgi:arginine deiminase
MKDSLNLNVFSEIGKLKKVLLHRPGMEIENLTPELLERLLFDDIPYMEEARREHDYFADVFRQNGVEVYYLEDLAAGAIDNSNKKEEFVKQFLKEANIQGIRRFKQLEEHFKNLESPDMINKMMAGIRLEDMEPIKASTLAGMLESDYPFIVDPLPNLYFTRDPFSIIGNGISLNKMASVTRNRETIFGEYIFKYHPMFINQEIPKWYDRYFDHSIEGGDQLVLSKKVIAIGISQRTNPTAIERFAKEIFNSNQGFETILAFDIPKKRAFMHLDTVFTMVDYDKFTIHPEIEGPLTVYSIRNSENGLVIEKENNELDKILSKYLNIPEITLIRCGGKKGIDAGREQWNDGSNTLAVSPGEVIVYSRNHVTNKILRDYGIKLHVIPSSELSRGRGGPRCMSMPLYRENL